MKPLAFCLICMVLLALPGQTVAAGMPGKVVLTAPDVDQAPDIEQAMLEATAYGTRPGIVILDGSQGPFEYPPGTLDVDVNIFVSDFTLRGVNSAVLKGALTLDGMYLENITIENLFVDCVADCITSTDGWHENIVVRNNQVKAGYYGIAVAGPGKWLIRDNDVLAAHLGVHLLGTAGISVLNNHLNASAKGIWLEGAAHDNRIIANTVTGVHEHGIFLDWETYDNDVHGNLIACAPDAAECQPLLDLGSNRTGGNR